ncbi:NAD(P)-binding domain-containing protein [Sphaerisporangium sp. B11E5]|uniref:NAD(P)-binding domain-containing protein n=1 Tax=Sphaerisporangium sp. B11E5 TaxID=3153563 RepID=UPI00325E3856
MIAFLGLGRMGVPMAGRLVAAGYKVTAWNRTPKEVRGVATAATAAEAVADAGLVVTMLRDPAAVEEVLTAARPRAGSLVVEMSTIGPEAVARLRGLLPGEVGLVDAPVLGSVGPAADGTLTVLAGGSAADLDRCREVLRVFGTVREVGPLGAGAAMKLAVMGAMVPAHVLLAETLAYATTLRVDHAALLDVLSVTPLGGLAERVRPAVLDGVPPARYALGLAAKDVALAAHGTQTLAAAALDRLRAAVAEGLGEADLTAVFPSVAASAASFPAASPVPEAVTSPPASRPVKVNPASVPAPAGAYSHAVRSGDLLFVSGQAALDEEGRVVGEGDITRQSECVFDYLERILADQGCTLDDIVNIRSYVTDMSDLPGYAAVRRRRVSGAPPSSTTVEVPRLFRPGLLIEVDVVAALPRG